MNNNNDINWLVKALYNSITSVYKTTASSNCKGACCYKITSSGDDPIGPIGTGEKRCGEMTRDECHQKEGEFHSTGKCGSAIEAKHAPWHSPNRYCNISILAESDGWERCIWEDGDGREKCSPVAGHEDQRKCKCKERHPSGELKECLGGPQNCCGRGPQPG